MSLFRTEINLNKSPFQISYSSKLFFIGSCFSTNIGQILENSCFDVTINPFGVLYNPYSIKNNLELLLENDTFEKEDLNFFNDRWFSYAHHSSFSSPDMDDCLQRINSGLRQSVLFLEKTNYLVITFGTSWVYELKKTGEIVANCHKVPAREFNRFMIEADEIVEMYTTLLNRITTFNPGIKIIFTLSPIRHWKDGAIQNQLSKANLLIAIHKILESFDSVEYFPAYEIMYDDLRDYRFYEQDMLHPSETAIQYIWEKFKQTYMDDETISPMVEIEKLNKALKHKPFNEESAAYQEFLKSNLLRVQILQEKHPEINLTKFENHFTEKII